MLTRFWFLLCDAVIQTVGSASAGCSGSVETLKARVTERFQPPNTLSHSRNRSVVLSLERPDVGSWVGGDPGSSRDSCVSQQRAVKNETMAVARLRSSHHITAAWF